MPKPAPRARITVLPWVVWCVIGVLMLAVPVRCAHGAAIAEARADGIVITLHDEPCRLEAISNLKKRAVWTHGEQVVEGCFGVDVSRSLITFYFADKTAFSLETTHFRRIIST